MPIKVPYANSRDDLAFLPHPCVPLQLWRRLSAVPKKLHPQVKWKAKVSKLKTKRFHFRHFLTVLLVLSVCLDRSVRCRRCVSSSPGFPRRRRPPFCGTCADGTRTSSSCARSTRHASGGTWGHPLCPKLYLDGWMSFAKQFRRWEVWVQEQITCWWIPMRQGKAFCHTQMALLIVLGQQSCPLEVQQSSISGEIMPMRLAARILPSLFFCHLVVYCFFQKMLTRSTCMVWQTVNTTAWKALPIHGCLRLGRSIGTIRFKLIFPCDECIATP